jgi:hypothetical protein
LNKPPLIGTRIATRIIGGDGAAIAPAVNPAAPGSHFLRKLAGCTT